MRFARQDGFDLGVRPGDDMHADQFAFVGFDGLGAGIGRGLNCRDIADDNSSDEGVADLLHGAGQFDIGGLEHGVGAFDQGDQPARFQKSDCLMWHNISFVTVSMMELIVLQKPAHLAGDDQFLVGWNDNDLDSRFWRADDGFPRDGCIVEFGIEHEAKFI